MSLSMAAGKHKTRTRRERSVIITVRIPTETRDLIDAAAKALSKSRCAFIRDSAHERAIEVVLEERISAHVKTGSALMVRRSDVLAAMATKANADQKD